MSRHKKKLKDKVDDEIKLAGREALVPVTYTEAKFGLRICDSKPSDTFSRGHSNPMDVLAVNSLSSGKGTRSSSPRDGCFSVRWSTFSTRLKYTQEHRQAIV